jgi:hypothetical protein
MKKTVTCGAPDAMATVARALSRWPHALLSNKLNLGRALQCNFDDGVIDILRILVGKVFTVSHKIKS